MILLPLICSPAQPLTLRPPYNLFQEAFPDPAVQARRPLLVHPVHPLVIALCLLDGSRVLMWLSPHPTVSVIHSHTLPEPCGLGPVLGSGPTTVSKQ